MNDDTSSSRHWLLPWVWVLPFLLLFVATHVVVQSQYLAKREAALRQLNLNQAAARTASAEWGKKVTRDASPSAEDARDILNGGRPFEPVPGMPDKFYWTDPSGGTAILTLANGKWQRRADLGSNMTNTPNPNSGIMGVMRISRRLIYMGLSVVWLLLLPVIAGSWSNQQKRMRWAVHLLLIAIVATVLAMIGPMYWRAWNLFFQDDKAGWGLIMMGLSIAILVACRVTARGDGVPRCVKCRYELTGNVSGVCPECGEKVPESLRAQLPPAVSAAAGGGADVSS